MNVTIESHFNLGLFIEMIFNKFPVAHMEFSVGFDENKDEYIWTIFPSLTTEYSNSEDIIEWFESKEYFISSYSLDPKTLKYQETSYDFKSFINFFEEKNPSLKDQMFLEYLFQNLNNDGEFAFSRFSKATIGQNIMDFWGKNVSAYHFKEKLETMIEDHNKTSGVIKI